MGRPVIARAIKRRRLREAGVDHTQAGHANPGSEFVNVTPAEKPAKKSRVAKPRKK